MPLSTLQADLNQKPIAAKPKKMCLRKRKVTQNRHSPDEHEDYDNSDIDPDYKDEEENAHRTGGMKFRKADKDFPKSMGRQAEKEVIRNKAWKRKSTNIKIRKGKARKARTEVPDAVVLSDDIMGDSSDDVLVDKVKQKTRREYSILTILKRCHMQRLNNILISNNLKHIPIEASGNCFVDAIACQLGEGAINGEELRKQLCAHIRKNRGEYSKFLAADSNDEDAQQKFEREIAYLEGDGHWSNSLSDCLPLAVANAFHRGLRIYTSKAGIPVLTVHPSIGEEQHPCILLAYLDIPKHQHYDACQIAEPANGSHQQRHSTKSKAYTITTQATPPANSTTTDDVTSQANTRTTQTTPPANRTEHPSTKTVTATPVNNDATTMSSRINTPNKTQSTDQIPELSPLITPRKSACFKTPPKGSTSRKRKGNPDKWKKTVRKRLRLAGEEYLNSLGTVRPKRQMKSGCGKCRYKCSTNINEEERQNIFASYWNLGSHERQRDFICQRVSEKPTKPGENAKRRDLARTYTLRTDGRNVRVCKKLFLDTLGIGRKTVDSAMKNNCHGVFTGRDNRGRHVPANKTTDSKRSLVKEHIESFPLVESHYIRKTSQRKYLAPGLSISKMYDLYVEYNKEKDTTSTPVKSNIYREIFCNDYNISFHVPKKDQCLQCEQFKQKQSSGEVTNEEVKRNEDHIERKDRAREEKLADKLIAIQDKSVHVTTFDLEAVLSTPCSLVSQVYYKRKLNSYNLSVYSLGSGQGTCYMWDESEGGRGACEIGTCLIFYLRSLPATVKHVVFFSDTCTGQNRNQFVAAALLHAIKILPNIDVIEHKFLEPGHTQMECDSMHAAIEHAKKSTSIYIPSMWDTVVHMARRKNPYVVVPMKHDSFWDLKHLAQETCKNVKMTTNGKRINWLKIKVLRFSKNEENVIMVKENYDQPEFDHICVIKNAARGKKKQHKLLRKYFGKKPIAKAKKDDLLSLCKTGIIPSEYKQFYVNLPADNKLVDKLPLPDVTEEYMDTDED